MLCKDVKIKLTECSVVRLKFCKVIKQNGEKYSAKK